MFTSSAAAATAAVALDPDEQAVLADPGPYVWPIKLHRLASYRVKLSKTQMTRRGEITLNATRVEITQQLFAQNKKGTREFIMAARVSTESKHTHPFVSAMMQVCSF